MTLAPGKGEVDGPLPARAMRVGTWLRTTPGRLRLFSVAVAFVLLAFWLIAAGALSERRNAARSVGLDSARELVMANDLYAALADADATASSALLRETESDEVRTRFVDDVDDASRILVAITGQETADPAVRAAARKIAAGLPTYVGRVEAARTNSRLGNPVGAAYMRAASAQMRDELLPAATAIWRSAGERIDADYATGTDADAVVRVAIAAVLVLVVLAGAQIYTARRTRRVFNLGLAGATLLLLVLTGGAIAAMAHEQDALRTAQREGSDAVQLLSAGRILALQAQADANLALAERGTGADYVTEFHLIVDRLGGTADTTGLLDEARSVAARTDDTERNDHIEAAFADYVRVQEHIRTLDDGGANDLAVGVALSTGPDGGRATADALDTAFTSGIQAAQVHFDDTAREARRGFSSLAVALTFGLALAVVLALAGLQRRIGEYR